MNSWHPESIHRLFISGLLSFAGDAVPPEFEIGEAQVHNRDTRRYRHSQIGNKIDNADNDDDVDDDDDYCGGGDDGDDDDDDDDDDLDEDGVNGVKADDEDDDDNADVMETVMMTMMIDDNNDDDSDWK